MISAKKKTEKCYYKYNYKMYWHMCPYFTDYRSWLYSLWHTLSHYFLYVIFVFLYLLMPCLCAWILRLCFKWLSSLLVISACSLWHQGKGQTMHLVLQCAPKWSFINCNTFKIDGCTLRTHSGEFLAASLVCTDAKCIVFSWYKTVWKL